jgi:hypothetical protein
LRADYGWEDGVGCSKAFLRLTIYFGKPAKLHPCSEFSYFNAVGGKGVFGEGCIDPTLSWYFYF